MLAVVAIVAACGGGGSANPTKNGGGSTTNPNNNNGGGGGVADLQNAASKFDSVNSYKFKMEMAGGPMGDMLSGFGGGASGSSSFVISGTVIVKPEKASQVSWGQMSFIEVGGKSYNNILGSWQEDTSSSGGSSMADSLSPASMFQGYTSYGWKSAGEGDKNGVACFHYTVDSTEMAKYAGMLDVTGDAQWIVETWVAKDGGYPVNLTLTAKQGDTYAFKLIMDVSDINSPNNKVEAPI